MIFQSLDFICFLVVVVAVHWLLPSAARNAFLLAASYFFYGYIHPWFLYLLWFVTVAVYVSGLGMQRWPAWRRSFFGFGLAACLALLGVFKYFNFFADNFIVAARGVGFELSPWTVRIALPVGISFFAFQGMSYVIDVYRGDLEARKNFIDLALFKAFFPQLVAGPIERATHFLPQLEKRRYLTADGALGGVMLIVWGFFKKLVIADNVSLIANKVFSLAHPAFPVLWAGVFAFAIQIYADFSGYTDIARGAAKLLGTDLMENFRHPYLSTSPADFWRRWHISLSTWFRDYVYIPLGGNRAGKLIEARNVMITFLLSGLWHGASWNFVLWGAYWGVLIILFAGRSSGAGGRSVAGQSWFAVILMFALANVGWLLFRETDLHQLLQDLAASPRAATALDWRAAAYFCCLTVLYAVPLGLHAYLDASAGRWTAWRQSWVAQGATAAALFTGVLLIRSASSGDFIYFQF